MPPRPTLRRALAAGAAAVVLAVVLGLVGAAASGVEPVAAQTDPAPSTDPVPSTEPAAGDQGTDTTTTPVDDEEALDDAQARADADLRSVWVIVAALGAVAVGLLVLLVLYVRATNPERAARRRAELVARADARRGGAEPEGSDAGADDEAVADETVVAVVADARASADAAAVPSRSPAAVLSRDPEAAPEEGVRVLGAPVAPPTPNGPVRPESTSAPVTTGTGAGRRRARPLTASPPSGRRPGPAGPPPGPPEGDETVRIVPAPDGPTALPTSAGAGAVVAGAPKAPAGRDRPPPRSLVDSPPPPRRPRRVDVPPKKLGTPDAERVLVRPGQKPVRVPPSLARPGSADDDVDAPSSDDASVEDPDR